MSSKDYIQPQTWRSNYLW